MHACTGAWSECQKQKNRPFQILSISASVTSARAHIHSVSACRPFSRVW